MPCAVSREEEEFYEREENMRRYGVKELSGRVAVAVACELVSAFSLEQLNSLSKMAQLWIRHHVEQDRKEKS